MGYRSDVAYIIRVDTIEKAKEFVALVRLKGGRMFEALKECQAEVHKDDNGGLVDFNFYCGDVKWYDGYDEVDGHNELLAFVADEFNGYAGYRFIRLGENDDDVEILTGGNSDLEPYDNFYVHRSISIPFSYVNGTGDKITDLLSLT